MADRYGGDIITVTDDDGRDYQLEHLDTIEEDGIFYLAFVPADMDPEDPEYGIVLLREEEEGDEIFLAQLDDDDLKNRIYEIFMDRLFGDGEEENADGEEVNI